MNLLKQKNRSTVGSPTLAEQAFVELRRQLLSGKLAPGTRLPLEKLKLDLEIGFTPLREALMRLSSEGLVDIEDNRGFRAAPASITDMEDIMLTRAAIEALALEQAIRFGDVNWEATIIANYHRLLHHSSTDPTTELVTEDWAHAHREFHLSLIAACPSRWLQRFWLTLFDQAQRYRHLSVIEGATYRDDQKEHKWLMDAVISRDLAVALSASRSHIDHTCEILRKLLSR
jgi:GntR family carbon starvation induced transcriptional regulator